MFVLGTHNWPQPYQTCPADQRRRHIQVADCLKVVVLAQLARARAHELIMSMLMGLIRSMLVGLIMSILIVMIAVRSMS